MRVTIAFCDNCKKKREHKIFNLFYLMCLTCGKIRERKNFSRRSYEKVQAP